MTEKEETMLNQKILAEIGRLEVSRLFSYPECELEEDFIAFLNSYADLPEIIPENWTVIDFGCYQAVQGHLFRHHAKYIGIDNAVANKWRLQQDNAEYHECTIQHFIKHILPDSGIDVNRTFAVCSYVPDKQAREMVRTVFPYFRDKYCSEVCEHLPERM